MALFAENRLSRIIPILFAILTVVPFVVLKLLENTYGDLLIQYPVTVILITACLAYATGLIFVRILIVPIKYIIEKLKEVADGNLDVEMNFMDRKDEIGVLNNTMLVIMSRRKERKKLIDEIVLGKLSVQVDVFSQKDQLSNALKNMVESLRDMSATAARIAEGDLTIGFKARSSDDELGNAFELMYNNLNKIIRELLDTGVSLSSSIAELSSTTSQLAASTSETASAANEITTTIEKIRQTADISSKKADQLSQFTETTALNSQKGKKAINEALEGMQHIKKEMDFLNDIIMKLSEQTQSIDDIINSVQDIADQSNLLSVNASIEAAKAGEMGKGFSVVAQEIKSLADQSKESTNHIKIILNDIQKAAGISVMATERGDKAVNAGSILADSAGKLIQELSDKVRDSADSALQISASSREQLTGIEQLFQAMTDIKEAGFQNMEGAKQIEQAIGDLKKISRKLKEITGRFKV